MSENIPTCALSEDSDQPSHSSSLTRIFTGLIFDSQRCKSVHADNEDSDQSMQMRRLTLSIRCGHMSKVCFIRLRLIYPTIFDDC